MPPEKEVGPRDYPEGTDTIHTTTTSHHHEAGSHHSNGASRQRGGDTVPVQLQRRRLATYKCERLASGHRDPWQPWRPEKLSDKQIDAAVQAVDHLRGIGLEPMFDLDTLRAMWKSGHHQLVDELREVR